MQCFSLLLCCIVLWGFSVVIRYTTIKLKHNDCFSNDSSLIPRLINKEKNSTIHPFNFFHKIYILFLHRIEKIIVFIFVY